MGCAGSSQGGAVSQPQDRRHRSYNNTDYTGRHNHFVDHKPLPREPTPPPPREPTPPPPREPTPPPPREPTPPPPREPTPPPPREPTPPPPREPTPPPPREPTPPPPPAENGSRRRDGGDGVVRENYTKAYGIYECKPYDFRQHAEPLDKDFADEPRGIPFTDYDFGPGVAVEGETLEWKRPGDFRDAPVLFSDGTTRYDIGQGSAGTCWFLSMVAMLAERPELFHRVVPKDAWNPERGYFCCYFWRFGEWERVFIDDYLPVVYGTELWGAKSREDRNEMWPAFLEKAFARFHGNYNSVYGGQSGDAFLALTGGCSEYIDFDDALETDSRSSKMKQALMVHNRLKNACSQGECMLTTEVPAKYDGQYGLVGGHAYSLTNATTVSLNSGKTEHLVCVRNPWGHTEWKGAWSDGSGEWNQLASGTIPHCNKDDGEFWMSLRDFIKYFSGITVCSLIPDFDKDGATDSLNFCTTVYGEWFGETASGFDNRIGNPRYVFKMDDEGVDVDGKIPLVVQICQKLKHRQKNKASIRVDLYKVLGERTSGQCIAVLELLGDVTNVYKMERQMSGRYKVEPGQYALVPSTMNSGVEKEFLIRVYTPAPIRDVRELHRDYLMMTSKEFKSPDGHSIRFNETLFGRWETGYNAGGQVSHANTFYTNPQVVFEIPAGQELVSFTLMQAEGAEMFPIGMRVFQLEPGYEVPEDRSHLDYLYQNYESCPTSVEGQQGAFILGSSAEITYTLPGGRYLLLIHADDPSQEKDFSLIVRSSTYLQLQPFHL